MNDANSIQNPYIIGSPIDDESKFFGREELFQFIESNLLQEVSVILLHGQRRIGKSSVLYQLPKLVFQDDEENKSKFFFVFFDLQNKSSKPLAEILHILATKIINEIGLIQLQAILPSQQELEDNTDIFSRKFLPRLYHKLGDRNLVLLLDEFDVVNEENSNHNHSEIENKGGGFFRYLQLLVSRQKKLFIIPVVGRHLDEMPTLLNLFKGAPNQNIGLLEKDNTVNLIIKPVEGILEYSEEAIEAILELSAGHPYFTQVICFKLYGHARSNNIKKIILEDVKAIVEQAIETAEGGLDWFWKGISMPEQVVFSALAKAQFPEDPFTVLRKHGVIETKLLFDAADKLVAQGFVEKTQQDYTQSKVQVEFVRRWLLQRHSLEIEIWELEKIAAEKVRIRRDAADSYHEDGNLQRVLELYEDVLKINPNHFTTVLNLAEGYSKLGNVEKALEFYTRAYQFDPLRNTEMLLQEFEKYGHNLCIQGDLTKAKQQYQQVLEIEPMRTQAQQKLKEIEVFESQLLWKCEGYKDTPHPLETVKIDQNCPVCYRTRYSSEYKPKPIPNKPRKIPLGKIAIGIASLIVVSGFAVAIERFLRTCPAGKNKEFGLICVADTSRISRSERTFFPLNNPSKDKGIEAYKQSKYTDAVKFFTEAVAYNRNDPEVLIYYNNALARSKKVSFITLAAVVPADNAEGKAQEMLRGVAQAQNQFNQNNGLNGRLLEIAIANDGNQEKDQQLATAKQVAAELVKDKDILGVIGHNSSDNTKAALDEYANAKIAIISPTSTSIFLSSNVFFRTVPSDAASGKKLAEYAIASGLKKVVIFSNNDSKYSSSLRGEFKSNFERLNGEVVKGNKPIELNDDPQIDDGKAIAVSIFRYKAQAAVLFPDASHTPQALKIATSNYNLKTELMANPNNQWPVLKLLGGDTLYSPEILNQDKKAVEGLVLAVPWFREAPQSANFAQAAQKQWGAPVSWRTATSYDATQAFLQAIKSVSTNLSRETVLQALGKVNLSPSETSGGNLQFTSDGERQSDPILVQVKDGKFAIVPSSPTSVKLP